MTVTHNVIPVIAYEEVCRVPTVFLWLNKCFTWSHKFHALYGPSCCQPILLKLNNI